MTKKSRSAKLDPTISEEEEWQLSQIRQFKSRLNAKSISSVVQTLMTQRGYGETQAAEKLQTAWQDAVGEPLGPQTRPGKVTRGVLTVHVDSNATMQELYFMKSKIIATLKQSVPEMNIKDLRTRISS